MTPDLGYEALPPGVFLGVLAAAALAALARVVRRWVVEARAVDDDIKALNQQVDTERRAA